MTTTTEDRSDSSEKFREFVKKMAPASGVGLLMGRSSRSLKGYQSYQARGRRNPTTPDFREQGGCRRQLEELAFARTDESGR
jgi:hypothetical protein